MPSVREQLKVLMADVFGCTPLDISDDADVHSLTAWDSLHHLELMLELESEFDIRIPTEAMTELISIGSIESYLRDRVATDAYENGHVRASRPA